MKPFAARGRSYGEGSGTVGGHYFGSEMALADVPLPRILLNTTAGSRPLDLLLLAPFLIGLASSLHCVGMCGGIIGALSLSLPPAVRASRAHLFVYTLTYSAGRVLS